MKYGILTFHNIPNIGALLQALSLCKTYRDEGVDCEIIDYECTNIVERELTFHGSSNPIRNFYLKNFVWAKTKGKINACQQYMQRLGVYSHRSYTKINIHEANSQYDAFISGSDMIWNLRVTDHDFTYFLDFVELGKHRISYGSSIGEKWQDCDIHHVVGLLKKYDKLAVRETDTCNVIQNWGLDCIHVCDPTMLQKPEYWESQAIKPQEKGYVLVYFCYPEIMAAAKRYAKEKNLRLVVMNWGLPKIGMKIVGPKTPPEWMGYFLNAEAIFTDSFHGFLFSIYFKKKVWTANQGNRISSLLDDLNLTSCFVQNDVNFNNTIDYTSCHKQLSIIRDVSMNYIKETIRICNK